MRKLVLILAVGLMTIGLQAQEEAKEKKAEIAFESDVIDYGDVAHGADGTRVSKAYSTCGCTVPSPPTDPIAPGESNVIKVRYDTNRAPGPIRKTITVYTNASAEPYTLKIKGNLLPAVN